MFHVYIPLLFFFLAVFLLLFSLYFDFFIIFLIFPERPTFICSPHCFSLFIFLFLIWMVLYFSLLILNLHLLPNSFFFPGKTTRDKFNNTQVPKPQDMSNQKKKKKTSVCGFLALHEYSPLFFFLSSLPQTFHPEHLISTSPIRRETCWQRRTSWSVLFSSTMAHFSNIGNHSHFNLYSEEEGSFYRKKEKVYRNLSSVATWKK